MSAQWGETDFSYLSDDDEPEGIEEYRKAEEASERQTLRAELEREIDEYFAPLRERLIRQAVELHMYYIK